MWDSAVQGPCAGKGEEVKTAVWVGNGMAVGWLCAVSWCVCVCVCVCVCLCMCVQNISLLGKPTKFIVPYFLFSC